MRLSMWPARAGLCREEALLRSAEVSRGAEFLWIWESLDCAVVLGRNNRAEESVRLEQCRSRQIGVLQRSSGGGTVVIGPGCLNYAVILSMDRRPHLRDVADSYQWLLRRIASRFSGVQWQDTDLTRDDRKFAGCAQRRLQHALLHHGTILYRFDLRLISDLLLEPDRQPAYRRQRQHADFLDQLLLPWPEIASRMAAAFPDVPVVQ